MFHQDNALNPLEHDLTSIVRALQDVQALIVKALALDHLKCRICRGGNLFECISIQHTEKPCYSLLEMMDIVLSVDVGVSERQEVAVGIEPFPTNLLQQCASFLGVN